MSAFFERFFGDFLQSREYQEITLSNPLDMHLHLRQGDILKAVLPFSAQSFSGGVVMPNLKTPVTTLELANSYKEQIKALAPDFLALMTIYITDSLNKESLGDLSEAGIKILKLYPKGATTNSDSGVSSILNPNLLETIPTKIPIIILTIANGNSAGLLSIDVIKLVTNPVIAPYNGPIIEAVKIVPTTSKNTKGIFKWDDIKDNIIFKATPIAQNVKWNVLTLIKTPFNSIEYRKI